MREADRQRENLKNKKWSLLIVFIINEKTKWSILIEEQDE